MEGSSWLQSSSKSWIGNLTMVASGEMLRFETHNRIDKLFGLDPAVKIYHDTNMTGIP